MRTLRLLVGLSVVGSMLAASSAGCSSDDPVASGPGGGSDAAVTTDTGTGPGPGVDGATKVDSAVPTVISIMSGDLNVYLGQIAQLDASGTTAAPTTALAYKWTVDSAPAGSAIVTTSLFNASSAKPTFTPDLVGDYKVKVTVTGAEATAAKVVTVKAYEAQTVFLYSAGTGGATSGIRAAATVTDAGVRDLSCHVSDAGSYDNNLPSEGSMGADTWEGPPGTDSKAAYVHAIKQADAGSSYQLMVVASSATCATAPAILEDMAATDGLLMHPRISPNGQRVAYLRKPSGGGPVGDQVITVGADGTARRSVGAFAARADGGPAPDASVPLVQTPPQALSPRWMSDTKVGWLQFPTGTSWNIVVSDDVDNATASIYMRCAAVTSGDRPNQFAFLADGSVLVAQRVAYDDAGTKLGARDLLIFKPNATTQQCELVRNLTNHESDGGATFSSASNFSVSPDGTQVAYVDFDRTADAGAGFNAFSIWTAAISGLTPPAQLPGAPSRGAQRDVGPRWLAGGALLAWPQDQRSVDAGATTDQAIVVSPAGGGGTHVVANTTGANKKVFAIGNGSACTIAAAGGSGLAGFGALGALVALVARRRRANR